MWEEPGTCERVTLRKAPGQSAAHCRGSWKKQAPRICWSVSLHRAFGKLGSGPPGQGAGAEAGQPPWHKPLCPAHSLAGRGWIQGQTL